MKPASAGSERSLDSPWRGAWLVVLIGVLAAVAAYLALDFVELARYFPFMVGIACLLLVMSELGARTAASRRRAGDGDQVAEDARVEDPGVEDPGVEDTGAQDTRTEHATVAGGNPDGDEAVKGVGRYGAWLLGYLAAISLLGIVVASGLFVAAFLRVEAKLRWRGCLISALVLMAVILYFGIVFNMRWPESLWEPLASLV